MPKTSANKKTVKKSVRKAQEETAAEIKLAKTLSVAGNISNFIRKNSKLLIISGAAVLLAVLGNKYLIVAWVDKKPVTRFEYYANLDKRYGKDLREELIVEKLINDEAINRKVSVTNTDIANESKKLEEAQGGADKLNQILQMQNLSRNDLSRLLRLQLLRQKLFGSGINISDDEVNKYIDTNKETFASPSAEVDKQTKESVREQLKQTKINSSFNSWLTEALKSSRVIRL